MEATHCPGAHTVDLTLNKRRYILQYCVLHFNRYHSLFKKNEQWEIKTLKSIFSERFKKQTFWTGYECIPMHGVSVSVFIWKFIFCVFFFVFLLQGCHSVWLQSSFKLEIINTRCRFFERQNNRLKMWREIWQKKTLCSTLAKCEKKENCHNLVVVFVNKLSQFLKK